MKKILPNEIINNPIFLLRPLTFILIFTLMACGGNQASMEQHKTYSAQQFFTTTDFRVGSSSKNIFSKINGDMIITSNETGVFNAYRVDVSSGARTPLTNSTDQGIYAISWFPNDDRFLFQQDGNGDELTHIYLSNKDKSIIDLTPGDNVKAGFAGWSADQKSFYVFTNERDSSAFDMYSYDANDYNRELLYKNEEGLELADISDDGRWLVYVKNNSNADSDLYIVDLKASNPKLDHITAHQGNIEYASLGFSPDNKELIYATNEFGEFRQAWKYSMASGKKSLLIAEDWDVMYVSFSPSGRYQISAINNDASTDVTLIDLSSNKEMTLSGIPEGDLSQIRFNRDESGFVFSLNQDTSPSNLYHIKLGGTPKKLTNALNPEINDMHMVEGEVVRFSSYDGVEIPGILYQPKNASAANPVPALVWVHGGPGGQSRKGYSAAIQHLVNHGYAVYQINNRGSSGYGKTFYHLDDLKHGEADLGDVVASREFLSSFEWINGDRIGIIGGSYGGYMVAAALAFEPESFDVGINIFGVTNWVRTLESIPPWWGSFRTALFAELGDPSTDKDRLTAISPLFHAEKIIKPLLVVQGANDPRVLQVESDELVERVMANDVPVEYVLFDDEGHGFRKRINRVTASEAYLSFLEKYL